MIRPSLLVLRDHTVATWDGDQLTVWSKSQYVTNEAAELEAVFGLAPGNVRVISPFAGV